MRQKLGGGITILKDYNFLMDRLDERLVHAENR